MLLLRATLHLIRGIRLSLSISRSLRIIQVLRDANDHLPIAHLKLLLHLHLLLYQYGLLLTLLLSVYDLLLLLLSI